MSDVNKIIIDTVLPKTYNLVVDLVELLEASEVPLPKELGDEVKGLLPSALWVGKLFTQKLRNK